MQEAILMLFAGVLQGFGAYYAFNTDGVLAKMAGIFFCMLCLGCLAASWIFYNDYMINKRKGQEK